MRVENLETCADKAKEEDDCGGGSRTERVEMSTNLR